MHGLLITFTNKAPLDQIAEENRKAAEGIKGAPGLISKAWIHDGDLLGGFYVFASREAAEGYAAHATAAIEQVPVFSDVTVRHFGVIEDLSVLNGTPNKPLAER